MKEEKIIVKQHGGKREGAGRKKTVSEGAKVHSFALTDEETKAVKRLVSAMRRGENVKVVPQNAATQQRGVDIDQVVYLGYQILKPIAKLVVELNGNKANERAERIMKDIAIMAFKDAVCDAERK